MTRLQRILRLIQCAWFVVRRFRSYVQQTDATLRIMKSSGLRGTDNVVPALAAEKATNGRRVQPLGLISGYEGESTPPLGVTLKCRIAEVYDGDTVTVEWTHSARVRLLDCWAPEIRTKDFAEKERGLAAKKFLQQIAEGKPAILHVPSGEANKFGDLTSMGRVLGDVWVVGNPESLAQRMRASGHAISTQEQQQQRAA